MSIEIVFKKFTNSDYTIKSLTKENGYAVIFEKDNKSFLYHLLQMSNEELRLLPANIDTHNETQLIFNQNIFESFDSKLFKIVDDLNFMNAFCFGNETNLEIKTLKDVLKDSSISGHPFIEYSGRLIENDSLTFLMEFFLTFNFVNGSIYFKENYSYFLEDYLNAEDLDSFKSVFMNHYGSNKINKNLNDVILKDSTIAQMLNL